MILEIKNLSVRYKGKDAYVDALKNINVSVKKGEILGIVGESGSGKSTLAFSLLNLLPEDSIEEGEIIFKGKNIPALKEKELQKLRGNEIGMVFQEPAATLNPVLSIGYQFAEILRCKRGLTNTQEIKDTMLNALGKVHLTDCQRLINSYPHQLSGGQLQRICLGFAVALSPAILIADEPTSSLDVTIESQIIDLIRQLRRTLGLTIIFITHNLDLVKTLCDRALVLYKGEVKEIEPVTQLFAFPKDTYTKNLLAAYRELEE